MCFFFFQKYPWSVLYRHGGGFLDALVEKLGLRLADGGSTACHHGVFADRPVAAVLIWGWPRLVQI